MDCYLIFRTARAQILSPALPSSNSIPIARQISTTKVTQSRYSTEETFDSNGESGLASNALIEHQVAWNSSGASCLHDIGIGAWFETPSRVYVGFLQGKIYDAMHVGVLCRRAVAARPV